MEAITLNTTDGGINWVHNYLEQHCHYLESIYFVNNEAGLAVGYAGLILKTTNGGINWITQTSGTQYEWLYARYLYR